MMVALIAILGVATVYLAASIFSRLANFSRASTCGLRAFYAAEAAQSDMQNAYLGVMATSTSCTKGRYVMPNANACALPGSPGTIIAMDNSCSYSAQISSITTTTASIVAIGRCTIGDCSGNGSAIVKLNTTINGKAGAPSCIPASPCDNLNCGSDNGCGTICGCTTPGYSCSKLSGPGVCVCSPVTPCASLMCGSFDSCGAICSAPNCIVSGPTH